MNRHLLVSDTDHFDIQEINPYEDTAVTPDAGLVAAEHQAAVDAYRAAGIEVTQIPSPPGAMDGVYTANWAFVYDDRAMVARLPTGRHTESAAATRYLEAQNITTEQAPYLYSGQGDTLLVRPAADGRRGLALMGHGHRTDVRMAKILESRFDLGVLPLKARTKRHWWGGRVRNRLTGLYDSYWYDIDIAIGVVSPNLLAVCWGALTWRSRRLLRPYLDYARIEYVDVSVAESRDGFGCNLVSTGDTVIMSDGAPNLAAELERRGFTVVRLRSTELRKGGGGYRCISLALDGASAQPAATTDVPSSRRHDEPANR